MTFFLYRKVLLSKTFLFTEYVLQLRQELFRSSNMPDLVAAGCIQPTMMKPWQFRFYSISPKIHVKE